MPTEGSLKRFVTDSGATGTSTIAPALRLDSLALRWEPCRGDDYVATAHQATDRPSPIVAVSAEIVGLVVSVAIAVVEIATFNLS